MASPDFVKSVRELPESTLIVDFKVKPVVAEIAETDPLNIPKPTLLAVDEIWPAKRVMERVKYLAEEMQLEGTNRRHD